MEFAGGGLIALVVAFIIAQDADKRGMSPWFWGIFTFLALIIALPVYFIVRNPRQDEGEAE